MNLSEKDLSDIRSLLGRDARVVETYIFDTMWSEHCSYKSSKSILKQYLPVDGSDVALGIGEDSGAIRFVKHDGKQYCIVLSHESHNHPSQILPVEGAATGVGGCVRDVYCMGADVIGVLNSLHFGVPEQPGALVDDIAKKVVLGISDYANPLGVPVLGGETLYHSSYNDNCLVNVAAVGLIEEDHLIHSYVPEAAKMEPYDVILIGKSTDATGFGGASFSSGTLDSEDQDNNVGAVQVHDPFLKRVLVEAIQAMFRFVRDQNIDIGFKDLGAGGISCATSELGVGGGFGIEARLDDVNVGVAGLKPEVIACSETQERFCVVVPRRYSQDIVRIFNEQYQLPSIYKNAGAFVIGEVIADPVFRLLHGGETVCELPIAAITTEVSADRRERLRDLSVSETAEIAMSTADMGLFCEAFLKSLDGCAKRYIYRHFDHSVKGKTVVYPGEADAVVLAPIDGCDAGLAVSMDSNLYGRHDPYVSGAAAVAESIRNVIAVGAQPIALTDCLNYGNPEKEDVFFDFRRGVEGIGDAARALGMIPGEALPIISGNVSFYNESKQGSAVVPSPVVMVAGKMENYRQAKTMQVYDAGLQFLLLGKRYAEFGGTAIHRMDDRFAGPAPQVRYTEEHCLNELMLALHRDKLVVACHDVSTGGVFQTVSEMLFGERGLVNVGATLDLSTDQDPFVTLFSENGGYVVAIDPSHIDQVTTKLSDQSGFWQWIGKSVDEPILTINHQAVQITALDLAALSSAWNHKTMMVA